MEIVLEVSVGLFILVCILMNIKYFFNLFKTCKYVREGKNKKFNIDKKVSMLILIPVLREQNVIVDTIKYFNGLRSAFLDIHLCIAGTKREYATLATYGFTQSTKEVVENYMNAMPQREDFTLNYFEAEDMIDGDRATQLNYAAKSFLANNHVDIIGVYDADSRPSIDTLEEVACKYLEDDSVSYQQPAFFMKAIGEMKENKENPLLMANAVYQNTWSIISEIPMWIDYTKSEGRHKGNFYCIGHGEFFPLRIYEKYNFPEHEVTDGIQIGYRLAMGGEKVSILNNYCSDDVPHNVKALIHQHKRWFGGCMRLKEAYSWCAGNDLGHKKGTLLAGLWSQFRWAFTANLYILCLLMSIVLATVFNVVHPLIAMGGLFVVYCYIYPLIATLITPIKKRVPFLAFMLVPLAIYIKSIGPTIYIFNKIFRRKNIYGKVER